MNSPVLSLRVTVKVRNWVPLSPSVMVASPIETTAPVIGSLDTLMSSTPTHSSLPVALVVRMRTWTWAWLLTALGSVTSIGVTWPAIDGPWVASEM